MHVDPYRLVDLCSDNIGTCLHRQGILHKHIYTSLHRSYHIHYQLHVLQMYIIIMKACLQVLTAHTHSPQSSMSEAEQATAITAAAKQIAARVFILWSLCGRCQYYRDNSHRIVNSHCSLIFSYHSVKYGFTKGWRVPVLTVVAAICKLFVSSSRKIVSSVVNLFCCKC